MWLECIDVVSGYCCKEVYRFPQTTPLVLALFFGSSIPTLFIFKNIYICTFFLTTQVNNTKFYDDIPYFLLNSFIMVILLLCGFKLKTAKQPT